ncbi:MAG: PQQ-dependent sugar dehydrogenase [Granulosicoccus sp.]
MDDSPSVNYSSTVVADGLANPWSIAFLPDQSLLITERAGTLRRFNENGLSDPIAGLPPVYANSQGGLFDVVLHPDFEDNGWIYLSLAHGNPDANATRVIRARLINSQLVDMETVFTAIPYKDTPVHYGARFTFLPDRSLVLGVGDGFDFREQAQALDSHLGKFIRVLDDGSIPKDNPFIDNSAALPEIYSLGHRNQQAIVYDAIREKLWAHEHGPAGGDEINELKAGTNYGWPLATRGRDYSGAAISPYQDLDGTAAPDWNWTPSIAPAGMTLITHDRFTQWQGDLLVAALKSRDVRRMRLVDDTLQEVETLFSEFKARLRDIRQSPDGTLYLLTDHATNGQIIRIEPVQ